MTPSTSCAPTPLIWQPGDILTIGETPVAVIQGRYRHPSEVEPGMVARLACRVFTPPAAWPRPAACRP